VLERLADADIRRKMTEDMAISGYSRGVEWDKVWGLVFMFFIVVFVVERVSVSIRRRLV
jgi:ABC-type phosphate/phosphonate transport system permease subunit